MVCNPVEQRKKTPSPAAREWHGTRFPLCHKETVLLVRDNVQRSRIASSVSTTISSALVLGLVRANKKPAATTTTSGTARLSWWWQRKRETPWRLPAQPRTQTRSVLFCFVPAPLDSCPDQCASIARFCSFAHSRIRTRKTRGQYFPVSSHSFPPVPGTTAMPLKTSCPGDPSSKRSRSSSSRRRFG